MSNDEVLLIHEDKSIDKINCSYKYGGWTHYPNICMHKRGLKFAAVNEIVAEKYVPIDENTKLEIISDKNKFFIGEHNSICHFIHDTLGFILNGLLIDKDAEFYIIENCINQEFKPFFFEFMKKNNVNYKLINDKTKIITANNAFISDNEDGPLPSPVSLIYENLLQFVENKNVKPNKKTYISRKTFANGKYVNSNRLINEEVLEDFLFDYEFEIIRPENDFEKDLKKQINYFYQVKTLISVTTSGLCNSIFMPPDGNVIEIVTHLKEVARPISTLRKNSSEGKDRNVYEVIHNYYKYLSKEKNHLYWATTNSTYDAIDVVNYLKNNKYLMQVISD